MSLLKSLLGYEFRKYCFAKSQKLKTINEQRTTKKDIKKGNLSCTCFYSLMIITIYS